MSPYLNMPLRTIDEAKKDIEENKGKRTVASGRTSPQSIEIKGKSKLDQ